MDVLSYHIASMLTLRARRQPVNHIFVIDVVVVQVWCYPLINPCSYQFEEPSRKNSETNRWMIIMETLPPWQSTLFSFDAKEELVNYNLKFVHTARIM